MSVILVLLDEVDLLGASRPRLLSVADAQRTALADRLELEAGHTLSEDTRAARNDGHRSNAEVDEIAERSIERLDGAVTDLGSLALGLGPAAVSRGGLGIALQQLEQSGEVRVQVALTGPLERVSPTAATTLYFAAAEGSPTP